MVEGARLESVYTGKPVSRVRISHSPPFLYPFSGRAAVPGSCAMEPREPRQVRKEAALSESFHVPRGRLGTAVRRGKGWRAARNGCFFTIMISLLFEEARRRGRVSNVPRSRLKLRL